MYTVVIPPTVQKKLTRLPKSVQVRVGKALTSLTTAPKLGKPLKGELANHRTLRVWPYRIIYQIIRKKLVILVADIGHRQGIYK